MSYEEDIAFSVQQMLDADLQFPQDVPVRNVVETNADHIRSMTDEELAYLLHGEYFEGFNKGLDREFHEMLPRYKEWLRQPYKEDT